jgi:hypothetical protein
MVEVHVTGSEAKDLERDNILSDTRALQSPRLGARYRRKSLLI